MDIVKIAKAIYTPQRRFLIQHLDEPLDLKQCFQLLHENGFNTKYKASVYHDLEALVEAGIIDKRYDINIKRIVYQRKATTITIELPSFNSVVM